MADKETDNNVVVILYAIFNLKKIKCRSYSLCSRATYFKHLISNSLLVKFFYNEQYLQVSSLLLWRDSNYVVTISNDVTKLLLMQHWLQHREHTILLSREREKIKERKQ